jgi:plasmanylethanolamine desaturase
MSRPTLAAGSRASQGVELASLIAAGGLLALLISRLALVVGAAWWLPLAILAAGAVADLMSGIVHWAADTWGRESWPVVGPRVLRPFRVHHVNPDDMLGRGFLDLNGDVALLALPLLGAAWLTPLESVGQQVTAAFFTAWGAWALPTNQVHQWAHHPRPPRLVRWLQRARLILPPAVHRVHHAAPYATSYCITTGWCNPWTSRIGLFTALERLVTALTGLEPRQDECRPDAAS